MASTAADPLDADAVRAGLDTRWMGQRVFFVAVTASTNDIAWKLAEADLPHGTVVITDQQERGRGSRGRVWYSRPGQGLLFSALLRLELPPDRIPSLTATTAIGVSAGIEKATGLAVEVLWPNDLVLDDRKVGGILVESRSPSPSGRVYVVGVGLNVHQEPQDFPEEIRTGAGSLRIASGRRHPRREIARSVLAELEDAVDRLVSGEVDALDDELRRRSHLLGRTVELELARESLRGTVTDVSIAGDLRIRGESGPPRHVPPELVRRKRVLPRANG